MKRFTLLLLLLITAALSGLSAQQQGFTIEVEPTYRLFTTKPDGTLTSEPQYGVAVKFCSDNPDTVAFTAELAYIAENSQVVQYVNVLAMANFNKCGVAFAWVGKTKEVHAGGWEITSMGKRADSKP